MENRLQVFAYNKGETVNFYKGHHNGLEFVPKFGFCESVGELKQFDYVQFYANDGLTMHIGHKMSKVNIEDKMRNEFIRVFGKVEQKKLF